MKYFYFNWFHSC